MEYKKIDFSNYSKNVETNTAVYTHKSPIIRTIFTKRLSRLMSLVKGHPKLTLDFGCGEGVLLPTLSNGCEMVYGIDLNISTAKMVIKRENLKNVTLFNEDISKFMFENKFDLIVCADVLEHFADLSVPINFISKHLNEKGILLISVPTENLLYRLGRKIFKFTKPIDHYHVSKDIINFITSHGFTVSKKYNYPFNFLHFFSAFQLCTFLKDNATSY